MTTTTTQAQNVLPKNHIKVVLRSNIGHSQSSFIKTIIEFQKMAQGVPYFPKGQVAKRKHLESKLACYWLVDNQLVFKDYEDGLTSTLNIEADKATIKTELGNTYVYWYATKTLIFEGEFVNMFKDLLIPEIFIMNFKQVHPRTKVFSWVGYSVRQTIWEEFIFRLANSNFGLETTSFNIPEYDEVKAYSVLNWISEDEAEDIIFKRDRFNGAQNVTKRIR